MSPDEYLHQHLERYLAGIAEKEVLIARLLPLLVMGVRHSATTWQGFSEEVVQATVLALKADAERHWRISWEGSLERANQIIAIGEARGDLSIQALGMMAKGDAIKMDKARWQEAWLILEHAGQLYRASHLAPTEKEIGWARTRIGRLFMAPELEKTEIAYREGAEAQKILERYNVYRRLFSLHFSWARAYDIQLNLEQSLLHYDHAHALALQLGEEGKPLFPSLYHNMAIALDGLGQTEKAIAYLNKSLEIATIMQDTYSPSFLAIREVTLGSLYRYLGAYGRALRLAYHAEPILAFTHPRQWVASIRLLMRCALDLKRFTEARRYGEILLEHAPHHKRDLAFTHRFLAQADIGTGSYTQAQSHLETARILLVESGFNQWVKVLQTEQARLLLLQSKFREVIDLYAEVSIHWDTLTVGTYDIDMMLVVGEAYFGQGEMEKAYQITQQAWQAAQQLQRMPYRYRAHLLLGKIAEAQHRYRIARLRYQAAVATTFRMHRSAGYTLHADLSDSFQDAFHRLMNVTLAQGQVVEALTVLETQKSRLFLTYLQERGRLRWKHIPEASRMLSELAQLRTQYQQWHRQSEEHDVQPEAEVLGKVEQRIRRLTEMLYLQANDTNHGSSSAPILAEVQALLPQASILLAYYDNGTNLWCFVVESDTISVYPLEMEHKELVASIERLYENQKTTLQTSLPHEALAITQAKKARHGYSTLGASLLAPIAHRLEKIQRFYIVPYGILHRLPFNVLRLNGRYLIEWGEVVTLPMVSLLARGQRSVVGEGMRWVGYSRNGSLPYAIDEVQALHARWGGELFVESGATRRVLGGSDCQVLHLSTHGIHRVDHHFDLSYVELSDADIYEDDILQLDLPYALVTLSACEAGAMKVAPGEELIGLGRAFLYAGVQALVASLWQVREEVTIEIMKHFYEKVFNGASKADALRQAQLDVLIRHPRMHPVYWGAFQLIGNAQPLIQRL